MTSPMRRTRSEELLLAKISAAAGREHLGKRHATYAGAAHTAHTKAPRTRGLRALPAFVRYGRRSAAKARDEARLDLYERGMTVAVQGRIHVVRYDTTSVFRMSTPDPPHDPARAGAACTLTDVDGKRIVLRGRPEHGDAAEWRSGIQRGVTRAQLPKAVAALAEGERLAFGDIWLTREQVGCAEVCARWPRVRDLRIRKGAVELDIDGTWHGTGSRASEIPNLFVLRALVELFHRDVNGRG
ncbi:DUF6585 family protein [Streptomyces sp. NPDC046261]|uniref:DUF6585 family protein n=1 Tax=Streptomyces sp. NPDC046261 TaxID=3157200 RepID=UPI0033DA770F